MTGLTPDSLTPLFRQHLGPETTVVSTRRGPLGNGQEIWFVETRNPDTRLVLRRTAASGPLTWTDRDAEYRVLQSLAPADLPTPTVRWAGHDGGELDRAYFVMDELPGEPVRRESPETLSSIVSDLGHLLAKLHSVSDLRDEPQASSAVAATQQQVALWRQRYREDRLGPVPLVGVLLAWLEHNAPLSNGPAVLLWGDPGPHNVLHIDGKITGLLDWELSHLGDPLDDLGAAVWSCAGVDDAEALIASYERELGAVLDRDILTYFEIFACVTRSIMLLNAVGQYVAGLTAAPNLAGLGLHLIHTNLERAVVLVGYESPQVLGIDTPDPASDRLRPDMVELLGGIAAFLRDDVQPHIDDRRIARGLKTVDALLATVAVRTQIEVPATKRRDRLRNDLLRELGAAGVDVTKGIEQAAITVETDDRLHPHRATVWRTLIEDLGIILALVQPLTELYEHP